MIWESDALLAKGKTYIQRAFETESREGELFPFWATIGLEFVGRAVLAAVHPSLLADPQKPESVLYACGFGDATQAKSVHAKTVFARCIVIVEGFSKADFAFCMSLMDRRNEELHTASAAFCDFPTGNWLADYRWAQRGFNGVRLETIRVGGTKCTSEEALQRFFDRLSNVETEDLNESQCLGLMPDVEKQLDELGIK